MGFVTFLRDYFDSLDRFLTRLNWFRLAQFARIFKELFVSAKDYKTQNKWLDDWSFVQGRIEHLLQREIYVLEEITSISHRERLVDTGPDEKSLADDNRDATLEAYREELYRISERLRFLESHKGSIACRIPSGHLICRYLADQRSGNLWEIQRQDCRLRGGCCDRDCGCCDRPRTWPTTGQSSWAYGAKSHCSAACGCCVRNRDFYTSSAQVIKWATSRRLKCCLIDS